MEAKNRKSVIIVSPSLDPTVNVSGVSSVVNFIVSNNKNVNYIHFQQGKADKESDQLSLFDPQDPFTGSK